MIIDEKAVARIIGDNIDYYLKLNDISRVELAKKLKISPVAVGHWCRGQRTPRFDKIDAMCEIFHCTRSDLLENKSKFVLVPEGIRLTEDEIELINMYRKLNDAGKSRVWNTLNFEFSQEGSPISEDKRDVV